MADWFFLEKYKKKQFLISGIKEKQWCSEEASQFAIVAVAIQTMVQSKDLI